MNKKKCIDMNSQQSETVEISALPASKKGKFITMDVTK
jgi:hypothetical protein